MSTNFEVTGDRHWSSERLAALKIMWCDDHKSSAECGRVFGVTRNAILGVCFRNDFIKPSKQRDAARGLRVAPGPKRPRNRIIFKSVLNNHAAVAALRTAEKCASEPVTIGNGFPLPEDPNLVSIGDLGPRSCRWISGPVRIDEKIYCGAPTPIGKPWCEHHHQIAYNRVPTTFRPMMRVR